MSNPSFDSSIPELTEVLVTEVPVDDATRPAPVASAPVASVAIASVAVASAPVAPVAAIVSLPIVPSNSIAIPSASTVEPINTMASPAPFVRDEPNQVHALGSWTDEEWRRLETDIRERIARQVLGRIDFVLEQRVRDSLADVLQTAVEGLASQIKQGLHTTLEEVIARAVSQEISRLKTTKN